MLVYGNKKYCNTRECHLFDTPLCNKDVVANKETRDRAEELGLPLDLKVYDLDLNDEPIGCERYRRYYEDK